MGRQERILPAASVRSAVTRHAGLAALLLLGSLDPAAAEAATGDAAERSVAVASTTTSTSSTTVTTWTLEPTTTTLPDCGNWDVVFRLEAADEPIDYLQFVSNFPTAYGHFVGAGTDVACTSLVDGTVLGKQQSSSPPWVRLLSSFAAPVPAGTDLARCVFSGSYVDPPLPGQFPVSPYAVSTGSSEPVPVVISTTIIPTTPQGACTNSCGDGVISAFDEDCDDGNQDPHDSCTAACRRARCGDGVVETGVEDCDDGNPFNNDACTNACGTGRCGDGILRPGVEQCDDGNTSGDDDCSADCHWTGSCGDGKVQPWLDEECDDGDAESASADCSARCRSRAVCGDPGLDGKRSAADALTILQHAVGIENACPWWLCDLNGSESITPVDALADLRVGVGLPVVTACPDPSILVVRIDGWEPFASAEVGVDYAAFDGEFPGDGAAVHCTGLVAGATTTFNDQPDRVLKVTVTSATEIAGGQDVARCELATDTTVRERDFLLSVSATRASGQPLLEAVAHGRVE